jgi:hypothetical protein
MLSMDDAVQNLNKLYNEGGDFGPTLDLEVQCAKCSARFVLLRAYVEDTETVAKLKEHISLKITKT